MEVVFHLYGGISKFWVIPTGVQTLDFELVDEISNTAPRITLQLKLNNFASPLPIRQFHKKESGMVSAGLVLYAIWWPS